MCVRKNGRPLREIKTQEGAAAHRAPSDQQSIHALIQGFTTHPSTWAKRHSPVVARAADRDAATGTDLAEKVPVETVAKDKHQFSCKTGKMVFYALTDETSCRLIKNARPDQSGRDKPQ